MHQSVTIHGRHSPFGESVLVHTSALVQARCICAHGTLPCATHTLSSCMGVTAFSLNYIHKYIRMQASEVLMDVIQP